MRVTHIITRLIVGGAQENTVASVLGLQQKPGLTVQLLAGTGTGPEGSLISSLRPPETSVRSLDLTLVPELVRPVHPLKDWLALRHLERILRQTRPHLVHTHSGKAGILGRLAAARAGVPLVVHTIHGPSFGNFQNAAANLIFRAAERRAARITTHFVSVADAMTRQYLAAGIGRPEQYTKIFSGFDLAPLLSAPNDPGLRARWGLAPGDFVVGKIARLFKLKGHHDLLAVAPELVRHCPRLKFLLVGDGPWRAPIEAQVRARGMTPHFIFTGLVDPLDIPRLTGIMDVLVHLSRREGLPRAVPMAMAAGKPVIAYDCDGTGEVCQENQTGFLLAPGDQTGLTRRLLELARDNALGQRLGRQGQQWVRTRFSAARMVEELHELYLRLTQTAGILIE